ncbi:MAG: site-specific DNA-methyltransferase [Sandaracinaceae bacterium]|nr:site-specific DNA-methyltransferase [Sandaracinaceae bacterium]
MSEPRSASRVVHHGDGLAWLAAARGEGALRGVSIITSLPDVSELPTLGAEGWERWFVDAARACCEALDDDALAIFFQSDVKHTRPGEGAHWIDKGALVTRGASEAGLGMVFHRIVLRVPAGTVTHGRAAYSHLLGFSRRARLDLSRPGADVIPDAGPTTWTRGMGLHACRAACEAVIAFTPTRVVLDPFCGHGTVLAVANELGLDAIGVELGGKRARKARALTVASLLERRDDDADE